MKNNQNSPLETMSHQELVFGGIYQHYKGKRYRVHTVVRHSETLEELVYYETLYDTEYGRNWVRPKAMFLESVDVDGIQAPRFKYTGGKILETLYMRLLESEKIRKNRKKR